MFLTRHDKETYCRKSSLRPLSSHIVRAFPRAGWGLPLQNAQDHLTKSSPKLSDLLPNAVETPGFRMTEGMCDCLEGVKTPEPYEKHLIAFHG